ncbi:hypothetical protein B4168_2214 [Anoxybacillus flavithermus]|nr:hypothetical protein B4168_2214 [Anoxybacillus flavithermus]OAO85869.1 hypothetical protein GT23_2772 [Parageobacillus thermoglucosidasius]
MLLPFSRAHQSKNALTNILSLLGNVPLPSSGALHFSIR